MKGFVVMHGNLEIIALVVGENIDHVIIVS